ncbi:MAG: hypothetical protein EBZ17_01160, partial [Actinobacteria bacterium]|nr:hypothetical protein [Actinomycetota bacterium]
ALGRAMIEWLGPILVEYWGTSEAGVFTRVDSVDWLAHPGTVGRPVPGFEVFAVDDTGALVETQHPDHHRRHEMRAADLLLLD